MVVVKYKIYCDPYRSDVAGGGCCCWWSSPELGSVTGQLVLWPHQNRLLPNMETDRSCSIPTPREIPKHTGLVSVLVLVARSHVLLMHRYRMIPMLETDHPQ